MLRTLAATFLILSHLVGERAAANGFELIIRASGGDEARYTVGELDTREQVSFTTSTIWTNDVVTFSGVPLKDLLPDMPSNATLTLVALNDYAISIPMAEIGFSYPIVATRMDGSEMAVRDKGPFWLVYPYDSDASLQTETIYARSIWQLIEIRVSE